MTRTMLVAALGLALAGAPAAAHENADRVMGIVEHLTAQELVVRATDGHSVTFVVTPETRFTASGKPVTAEAVQVGQRVAVHGRKAGSQVEAVQVKLGPVAPPAKKKR